MKQLLWQILFLSLGCQVAWSASVSKIKNDKVLILLSGLSVQKGDEFYTLDAAGKKRALVKISSIKGDQAMGLVTKGKTEPGHTLVLFKKAAADSGASGSAPTAAGAIPTSESRASQNFSNRNAGWSNYGILVGYLTNKMSAKFSLNGVAKSTDMAGNGFAAQGFYDYSMSPKFQIRGVAGIEQFQVSESRPVADCDKGTSTTCNAIINYLSGYGIAKYNFVNGPTRAWAGGGAGVLFALSKSSTVLESSQISSNYVVTLAGGIDINMKNGNYLPLVLEYSFFPNSNSVSANYIALRVGWGWR